MLARENQFRRSKLVKQGWFMVLITILVPQVGYAAAQQHEALARHVISMSGLDRVIASIPEQIEAQYNRRKPSATNPEAEERTVRILLSSYDPDRAQRLLLQSVLDHSDPGALQAIAGWLDSSLGRRLSAAELEASSVEGRANMMRYLADITERPPAQERIVLIQRFERAARVTDSMMGLVELIMWGFLSSLNEAVPEDLRVTEDAIKKQLETTRPMMKQLLWQQALLSSHYSYRNFSNAEIEQYITFLQSPAGQELTDLSIGGIADVFKDVFAGAARKLASIKAKGSGKPSAP